MAHPLRVLFFLFTSYLISISTYSQINAAFTADVTSGCKPLKVNFTDNSTGSINSWLWDFGNGNNSIYQNVSAVYTQPGTYNVKLTVTNQSSSSSANLTIVVYADPVVNFSADNSLGCIPLAVSFQDLSTSENNIVTWQWDLGDGYSSFLQTPVSHTYGEVGNYTISLTVEDDKGCSSSITKNQYIKTFPAPVADFSAVSTFTCLTSLDVQFLNNSTGSAISSYWQFGDGGNSTVTAPLHSYSASGNYDVTLLVTDTFGCSSTMVRNDFIQISSANPTFTLDRDIICLGESIPFNSVPVGSLVQWDFGDGTGSTLGMPTHVYAQPQTYTITLIVTDWSGTCTDTISKQITVQKVTASFSQNITTSCVAPQLVNFTNLSTNAISYAWSFGDGDSSYVANPSHSFADMGTYSIYLIAVSAIGCTNTTSGSLSIKLPTSAFITDSVRLCVGSEITFTDQSTSSTPVVSWSWNFGDGTSPVVTTVGNTTHVFNNTGDFNAFLTIVNDSGCMAVSDSVLIEVGSKQIPGFSFEPIVCASDTVTLVNLSTDTALIDQYKWKFGESGAGSSPEPMYLFTDTVGMNLISLFVGFNGCYSDTLKDSIFVKGPIASFDSVTLVCDTPFVYYFFPKVLHGDSLVLDFGDGTDTTVFFTGTALFTDTIVHTYEFTGNFPVVLTAGNDTNNCKFEVRNTVMVRDLHARFWISDTLPCSDEVITFDALQIDNLSQHAVVYKWYKFTSGGDTVAFGSTDAVNHAVGSRGDYNIMLACEDVNGCQDTIIHSLRSYKPSVGFLTQNNETAGCIDFSITFIDTTHSQGDGDTLLLAWNWNFGDGTINPTDTNSIIHTYSIQGIFDVTLTVTDTLGCKTTLKKDALILSPTPYPAFTRSVDDVCFGDSIKFTNTSQLVAGLGYIYEWEFNDGTPQMNNSNFIWHTFPDSGYFAVQLTVTDTLQGCDSVFVLDSSHTQAYPIAQFIADPPFKNCYDPSPFFTFTDSTGSIYVNNWKWNFGDGAIANGINPVSHTYFGPGTYAVQMIVISSIGCSDTIIKDIIVKGPIASISYMDTICKGAEILFIISDTTNLAGYTFDPGDGTTYFGLEDTIVHYYNLVGDKYPSLILHNSDSCEITVPFINGVQGVLEPIHVKRLYPGFSGGDTTVCQPYFVDFIDESVNSDLVEWNLGNGVTTSEQNPYTVYTDVGQYTVQQIVSGLGCSDSTEQTITILPVPVIVPSKDDILCVGDDVVLSVQDGSFNSFLWNNGATTSSITITPIVNEEYWVEVDNGCQGKYESNVDTYILDMPNTFTPNGDNQNDKIYVRGVELQLLEFRIYNRWGQLLFDTQDINQGWEGNFGGAPQNIDTYVYTVRVLSRCGKEHFKKGYFTLLR